MMAQKHLNELLKEDQEPFLLKNYISERRSQLKKPSPKTTLQVKKQKPTITHQNSNFPINLCRNACFLSFQNTPDIRKSPLFEFSSPAKSPLRSSNAIFIHIPAKTASLLLEAALRIQKQSKTKPQNKNNGFGVLGSFFKRLTQRKNRKSEIEGEKNNAKVSVKDIIRWDSSVGRRNRKQEGNKGFSRKDNEDVVMAEVGFTCSCNGRPSSAVWSESNEDKSLEMETSSSGHSYDSVEETECVEKQKENDDCVCFDDDHGFFCESPFRFFLQRSPSSSSSSGRLKPEFPSPAASPCHNKTEDKEPNEADGVNKFQSGEEEEEEEEKEQCSPVSVLDPPFDDDDDGHENNDEEGDFDLECSYANVQRTKQQLLDRLRRFEKLAELDPLELEKRMVDQEEDECETFIQEDSCEDDASQISCEENAIREVFEILCHSNIHDKRQAPEDLKRLVHDLIMEERRELNSSEDMSMVMRRVCRNLDLWKEVESNTIDMMIEEDFSREEGGWKKNAEQTRELAGELELAIFCFLVEEFSEELLC